MQSGGSERFCANEDRGVSRPSEFVVGTSNGEFHAPAPVVATGGLSIPKLGATSCGYELARPFGITIRDPWPGLVPLVLSSEDHDRYCDLTGVAAEAVASCDGQRFREKMLITHRGLSGPAILQISSYWDGPKPIAIDLAPERAVLSAFEDGKVPRSMSTLPGGISKGIADPFCRSLARIAPAAFMDECISC
jgi:predicted flavoprotein YhiN